MSVWYQTTALHLHISACLPLSLLRSLCALLPPSSLYSPYLSFFPPQYLLLPTLLPLSSGKYIIEGQMLRAKAQLEHLHSNIASVARKTDISSATKLALLGPSREGREEDIPLVEWWDAAILPNRR